jgi:hypothetical protein
MEEKGVITFPCFTQEQVKEINKKIKKIIFQKEEKSSASETAVKIGEFFHVPLMPLMESLHSWLYQCQVINKNVFGYDIYWDWHLEYLNYNVYGTGGEYGWHIDTNSEKTLSDSKLTCLLNLSEEIYEGGEFYTIGNSNEEVEFTTGMGLVMTSLIGHKVTPITQGERITLAYWAHGPSWK